MTNTRRSAAGGLALLLAAYGCGGGSGAGVPTASPALRADSVELAEVEALYRARADSVRQNVAAADVAFMQGMIGHHAQALIMSGLAAERAGSDAVRTLSARVINAQNDEIASMRAWLEERDQPVPEIVVSGIQLSIAGGSGDVAAMPGMLTSEQMEELEAARGNDFDRLFLSYMIQHHSGAVTMVHQLFATDGAAQDDAVFKIASDIQVDQTTEVNRMELMLEALRGSS